MTATFHETATAIVAELIRKSGVNETADPIEAERIAATAGLMAAVIHYGEATMALPDYFKVEPGTAKTIKNSGGDAAITLASLANGNGTSTGARQSATLDLGANWAQWWRLDVSFEIAATPTARNLIHIYGSWSNSTGAGQGNTSGSDASYTGYSSNIDDAVQHLEPLGALVCTANATTTVQKKNCGAIWPLGRYLNVVVDNRSGAALHSTDTNQAITFTPLEYLTQDAV